MPQPTLVSVALPDARRRIETWRIEYNTARPHKGLGRITPEQFAARFEERDPPERLSA
jgi:putative transposase